MKVKVDAETMMLEIIDCDPVEGLLLSSAHNGKIDVVLVDATTPADAKKDLEKAQNQNSEVIKNPTIKLNQKDLRKFAEKSIAQGKKPKLDLNLNSLFSGQFKTL